MILSGRKDEKWREKYFSAQISATFIIIGYVSLVLALLRYSGGNEEKDKDNLISQWQNNK